MGTAGSAEVQVTRSAVLGQLAHLLLQREQPHPLRVGVDGRTASGKTTFADELAEQIHVIGRPVIRTSIDGFHRARAERYARGRYSAEGYYFDARDHDAIRRLLLEPLGHGGDGLYRTASFDLERDVAIEQEPRQARQDAVLIVDGTFLQRPELAGGWDVVLFLEVSESVAEHRGVQRDQVALGGADTVEKLYRERYGPAYAIYERLCSPGERADAMVQNDDLRAPRLIVNPGGRLRATG